MKEKNRQKKEKVYLKVNTAGKSATETRKKLKIRKI